MPKKKIYLMVNKPAGYITTVSDPLGRKTVMDLLPQKYSHLFPVGRLDKESEGLLLFTDDGDLAQQLTHPRYGHQKEYKVQLDNKISRELIAKLKHGVELDEGLAKVDSLVKVSQKELLLTLHQGWKRQIRRMIEAIDNDVVALQRIRIVNYTIESLGNEDFKEVDKNEII